MGYITEPTDWADQIFQKETFTQVLGGSSGPSNTQAKEIAGRTQKIKSVLKDNSIYIDSGDFAYAGQNFIFTSDFFPTVADGHYVYWNEGAGKFYKAIAGGSAEMSEVAGVADVTNGKVITDGIIDKISIQSPGTILYLSPATSGELTDIDSGVPIGKVVDSIKFKMTLHQYYKIDGPAITPSLRTLGLGSTQAAAGNDSRFGYIFPTGGIIMWSGLLANIPSGWYLCDGNNGTPNLLDRFVRGVENSLQEPGAAGGANSHSHNTVSHELTKAEIPRHMHRYDYTANSHGTFTHGGDMYANHRTGNTENGIADGLGGGGFGGEDGEPHTHGPTGNTSHIPKYFKVAYIMKG